MKGHTKKSEINLQLLLCSIITMLLTYYWMKMKLSSEHSLAAFSFPHYVLTHDSV